ncbi:alpha/beta fold hydrolase [Acidisoma sp. C75]
MRLIRALLAALALLASAPIARAADYFFQTSDGVRLHAIIMGRPNAPTIVFIPGWTMPAWIFHQQIAALSARYRVVALDPRGQGASAVPASGYDDRRRGEDIADLLSRLGPAPVVLCGWSLGVLDVLAYVHTHGNARIAGLVLIDNSVGEEPPPRPLPPHHGPPIPWPIEMRHFVRSMFVHPPSADYLAALTQASLRTPKWAAEALLRYPEPRSYWRDALYMSHRPVLYIVRPWLAGQAANVARHDPLARTVVWPGVGHAMFVEQPEKFDALLLSFLQTQVWPR